MICLSIHVMQSVTTKSHLPADIWLHLAIANALD